MFRPKSGRNIFDSIRSNDLTAVKAYLYNNDSNSQRLKVVNNGYSANSIYNHYTYNIACGDTLLLCAIKEGVDPNTNSAINIEIIRLLLENETIRFMIEHEDNFGFNALTVAAAHNRCDVVKLLLDAKADITAQDNTNKLTVLGWAAQKNSLEMVIIIRDFLLKNPDSTVARTLVTNEDKDSVTVLNYAIRHGNERMRDLLNSLTADVLAAEQVLNQTKLLNIMDHKNRSNYFGIIPRDISEMVVEFRLNHEFKRTR